jgi:hypothetical protein
MFQSAWQSALDAFMFSSVLMFAGLLISGIFFAKRMPIFALLTLVVFGFHMHHVMTPYGGFESWIMGVQYILSGGSL